MDTKEYINPTSVSIIVVIFLSVIYREELRTMLKNVVGESYYLIGHFIFLIISMFILRFIFSIDFRYKQSPPSFLPVALRTIFYPQTEKEKGVSAISFFLAVFIGGVFLGFCTFQNCSYLIRIIATFTITIASYILSFIIISRFYK